jgi:hypothetical protein
LANAAKKTPAEMNQEAKATGAYKSDNSGNIPWDVGPPKIGFQEPDSFAYSPCDTGQQELIANDLCGGLTVIGWVKGSGKTKKHFVLVSGLAAGMPRGCGEASCRLTVNDPSTGNPHTYLDEYDLPPGRPSIELLVYCQGGCLELVEEGP